MFKIIKPELLTQELKNDKLNQLEQDVLASCPILQRIATHQRPTTIQGSIPKRHNPDFLLCDSVFVEVKGFIRDGTFRPMLKTMPDWLKARYHIVNAENNKQRRNAVTKFCNQHGISVSEGSYLPPWVVEKALMLGPMTDDPRILWLDN